MDVSEFRVTSVWQYTRKWVEFAGVPLDSRTKKIRSGRSIVVVKTAPEILPMKPVVGQHWQVEGIADSREKTHGDFIISA